MKLILHKLAPYTLQLIMLCTLFPIAIGIVPQKLSAQTSSIEKTFQTANEFYKKNEFEKALELYHQLENVGVQSPELIYNLGNVQYKLKNIPYAIVYYERYLKLYGYDEDVQHNLLLAKTHLIDKTEESSELIPTQWNKGIVQAFTEKKWAKISILLSILFSIALFLMFRSFTSLAKKRYYRLSLILFCCLVLSLLFGYQRKKLMLSQDWGVVISPTVSAYSSPTEKGAALFIIHEGLKVKIESTENNWAKIRLPDQKVGWIPQELVKII